MNTFTVVLEDTFGADTIDDAESFIGEDQSGSFSILHGHARMITTLVTGLARIRVRGDEWRYVALPGAVLYFDRNRLEVATRRYLIGSDYTKISDALEEQLVEEERELESIKRGLRRMELNLLKRMREMGRELV